MQFAKLPHRLVRLLPALFWFFAFLAWPISLPASGPPLATLQPTSGNVGGSFFVFFPVINASTTATTNVKITAVTFGTAVLRTPSLPLALPDLAPGGVDQAVFTFENSALVTGKNYLLVVRGTYQAGGPVLGFSLNRIITFGTTSIFQQAANPLTVNPTLDSAKAVTQSITASQGGTITATSADGSVFTLVIPAKALLSDERITMTPVSAISGLPISGGLLAAVQFAPDGLIFEQPATLTIQPATTVLIPQQVGFGYRGNGKEFHFEPIALTQAITFSILHFSGVGVGQGTPNPDGTPTSKLDRLDNAEAPLFSFERQAMFPNDPPPNQQTQAESEGLVQQYFEQSLQPELQNAASNDALATDAVESSIAFNQQVQNLGAGNSSIFQADSAYIKDAVPAIVTKAYAAAFSRCEEDTSQSARLREAQKMQWLFTAPQALGAGGPTAFPNFSTQLATCLAGPLEMTYTTTLTGSGIVTNNGSLTLNGQVDSDTIELNFSPFMMEYHGFGALNYRSLNGVVVYPPPAFDCGSNFVGISGTISAVGKFDLNIDPVTIVDASQIPITLTVAPNVTELSTFAAAAPNVPCVAITVPTDLYDALFLIADGFGPNGFNPFVVHINIPEGIDLHGTIVAPGGSLLADITGLITLFPKTP